MNEDLKINLEKIVKKYTEGAYYKNLLEAKKEYFILTGQINEDDEDYESRMNNFNDWYILQFISADQKKTALTDYLENNPENKEEFAPLLSFNHSLFEFKGENFKGYKVLKDWIHGKKIILSKECSMPAIVEGDIFSGRVIHQQAHTYLLEGLCILPKEIKGVLIQAAQKVGSKKDIYQELNFLMKIEFFKTKWHRYGHLEPEKIFKFDY